MIELFLSDESDWFLKCAVGSASSSCFLLSNESLNIFLLVLDLDLLFTLDFLVVLVSF